MTATAKPLDLAVFEGRRDLDTTDADALLAECRAQREQIAALKADKAKLREALSTIESGPTDKSVSWKLHTQRVARAALAATEGEK